MEGTLVSKTQIAIRRLDVLEEDRIFLKLAGNPKENDVFRNPHTGRDELMVAPQPIANNSYQITALSRIGDNIVRCGYIAEKSREILTLDPQERRRLTGKEYDLADDRLRRAGQ